MKRVLIISGICLAAALYSCKGKPHQESTQQQDTSITTQISDSHSAESSLDIEGTYTGTLPCADCPGIKVEIILDSDKSFTYNSTYIDRNANAPIEDIGEWSVKGNILTLTYDDNSTPTKFFVGEGYIQQFDGDGKKITGKLSNMFILKKKLN